MRTADTDFSCPFLILQNITMMERNVSHMKVLLINGSPHEKGCTYTALHEMEKVFRENGVETELVSVGTNPIRGCIACGGCRKKGACVFSDLVNEIAPKFEACDGLVVGSPVYYASANATLVALLDRLFYTISGMPVAAGQYWNGIHGNRAEEAQQDGEGLQMMRTLARNMTFLMRSIELGKEKYGLPEKEPRIGTNFIR